MAATVSLKVMMEAAGIKPTTEQLKKLNTQIQKTASVNKKASKTSNELKRNLEGVGQRSGSTGKDFARMSQGMGGLVQAYATIAANVFALSSAFLVLRRAADLSSMIKSAENFSARFGVSVTEVTKRMQEASGGALSFAEALPTINKAVSAGVGIEQMEELTMAATKAAQTFGGSATEALNRFISASQRGRVEIIQTLGVVIKTEQAYKEYAATIGKTALELSAFDRQQAILNATIEASESVFAGVVIDPNPFQQFLVTLTDTKDIILTFITDGLTPLIKLFNQSKFAALALMAVIAAAVGKRIFPELSKGIVALQAKSIASTKAAVVAAKEANKASQVAAKEHAGNIGTINQKKLRKLLAAETKSYKKRTIQHKSFGKELISNAGIVNRAVLTEQRAALARQEKVLTSKTPTKGLQKGLSTDIAVIREQQRARTALTSATQNLGIQEAKNAAVRGAHTTKIRQQTTAIIAWGKAVKSTYITIRSNLVTGFSKGFATTQSGVIKGIKKMNLQWRVFSRSINTSKNSLKLFSAAAGRTAGTVAGAFAKMASAATSILLIVSLLRLGWELFGDRLRGISKDQRKLIDSFKELGDSLEEVVERNIDYIASMKEAPITLQNFIKEAEFLRGTLDSTSTAINDFNKLLSRTFGVSSVEDMVNLFGKLEEKIKTTNEELRKARGAADDTAMMQALGSVGSPAAQIASTAKSEEEKLKTLSKEGREAAKSIDTVRTVMNQITKEATPQLVAALASTVKLFEKVGFTNFSIDIAIQLEKQLGKIEGHGPEILRLFNERNFLGMVAAIQDIEDVNIRGAALKAIVDSLREGTIASKAIVDNFVASGRALQETSRNMDTYISGLDKARAASVPNKAAFNLLLDTQRSLQDLKDSAKQGTNVKLDKLITAEDIGTVRKFINLTDDITFDDALAKINKEVRIYNTVIEDSILKTGRFKVIQNEVNRLKNEELTTDERRIEKTRELNDLSIERASLERRMIQHQLAVAIVERQRLITMKKTGTLTFVQATETANNLILQEKALNNVIISLELKKDAEREHLKIIQEVLTTEIKLNKVSKDKINATMQLGGALDNILDLREKLFLNEKRSISLTRSKLQAEVNGLEFQKLSFDQQARRRREIEAEVELLKIREAILARGQLGREASQREREGLTIFENESLALAAQFFIREVQSQAAKVASTFETIGRGFSKVIQTTFDTAIDTLLEGGKNFSDTVREAFKAGLREIIGNALKNDMTRIFGDIGTSLQKKFFPASTTNTVGSLSAGTPSKTFNPFANQVIQPEPEAVAETRLFQTTMTDNAIKQTIAQEKSKDFLSTIKDSMVSVANSVLSAVSGKDVDVGPSVAKALSKTELTVGSVDTVNSSPTTDNAVQGMSNVLLAAASLNTEGVLTSSVNLVSTLWAIAAQKQAQEGATAFASGVGRVFGKGGVLPGGTGSMVALAAGAIATGPNLAVIGEGKNNEAVVPLPNNREIPVDLKGASGDIINIEQNFDFSNADTGSIGVLRTEARAIEDRTFNRVFNEINKGGKYAKIVGRR